MKWTSIAGLPKNLLKLNKYGIPEPEKIKKVFPDIILFH